MSQDLSAVATLGLEALEIGVSGGAAASAWLPDALERLQQARQPRGEAELMIVEPVERLVCSAAGAAGRAEPRCRADEPTAAVGVDH